MDEKTIEAMVREKEQEVAKENSKAAEQRNVNEDDKPSIGQRKNVLKNAEGDIKNIETELKISTSSEVELGLVGQLRGLVEKIKSGQLDLATAQNLLRSVNSLKGRVSTDLNRTNSAIRSTREMDNNIDKLRKLVQDKCDKELNDNKQKKDIEELQNLLKALEEKKKNLKRFMGYLLMEQKALKGINKGINGIQIAIGKQLQTLDTKKPVGIGKFIVAITDGIASLVNRSDKIKLPKDIAKRVPLEDKSKDGVKNIDSANEGILKILAQSGDIDKVKRILGEDELKQDLAKPIDMAKEETRNSIERKTRSEQQLNISEKHGIIKTERQFVRGKNKLYAPTVVKKKSRTKNNTITKNIEGRGKK